VLIIGFEFIENHRQSFKSVFAAVRTKHRMGKKCLAFSNVPNAWQGHGPGGILTEENINEEMIRLKYCLCWFNRSSNDEIGTA